MKLRTTIGSLIFLGLAVFAVVHFTTGPQSVSIMEPASFAQPSEIGSAAYRELRSSLSQERLLLFGVDSENPMHRQVLEGFLQASHSADHPIHVVLKESQLENIAVPEGTEVIPIEFNSQPAHLADMIRERTEKGQRVLVYTVNILSSHLIKGNPVHRFETYWGEPVLSISTLGVALRRDQEFKVQPPCVGSERDGQGTADLGCAALLKGRQLYRDNIDVTRYVALIDQRGPAELLLFISAPGAGS